MVKVMRKCLIVCANNPTEWIRSQLPEVHPLLLKIVNKPLLEYYIDYCSLLGINEIRVVMEDAAVEVENHFSDGSQWGVSLSYNFAGNNDNLAGTLSKNCSFVNEAELLVINTPSFIFYDRNNVDDPYISLSSSVSFTCQDKQEVIYLKANENSAAEKCNSTFIEPLDSIKSYYDLSMKVLNNCSNHYVLPAYCNDEGIFIGQNVEISMNTDIEAPVILGNNVKLQDLTSIGPNSMIGNNVIIDRSSVVKSSIILDNTFIGSDLEINKKIVTKNKLIDPESGECLELSDDFLLSEVSTSYLSHMVQRIIAYLSNDNL